MDDIALMEKLQEIKQLCSELKTELLLLSAEHRATRQMLDNLIKDKKETSNLKWWVLGTATVIYALISGIPLDKIMSFLNR